MTYADGKLTVPTPGRYYIYAQFYYHHSGRINLRINNNIITMLQPPAPHRSGSHGNLYTGGVFQLKAGDVITLLATNIHGTVTGHMNPYHSYFGAFLIWRLDSSDQTSVLTAAIKLQPSAEADFFIFLKANKHKLGFNERAY